MNNQGIKKFLIEHFWNKVSLDNKLELLKILSMKVYYKPKKRGMRKHFDKIKNNKYSFNSRKYKTCFACGGKCEARHHIIQIQHGGNNSKRNIVGLCKLCHAEIHPWLK